MDFARPHMVEESTASRSRMRYISTPESTGAAKILNGDASAQDPPSTNGLDLDAAVVEAANKAIVDTFIGPDGAGMDKATLARFDAADLKEALLPPQGAIQEEDLVVIMVNFDNLSFVYAKPGAIFSNRHGHFHHDDFIGKPFGCKIRSRNHRGFGFCYLLRPTPELWTRSLNHRTQIIHELDQSQIVHQLWLRPNQIVVESGTGSAALSHSLLRAVAPYGHLHTYEFHPQRADTARVELEQHSSPDMVTVYHKDVCGKAGGSQVEEEQGGFGLPGQSVDAVFLDLPEPWLAIPHAAFCLKANGRIASYSPCVEQSQRAVQAFAKAGFHSVQTMEYRLQEHYVDEVAYEELPRTKRQRPEPHDPSAYVTNYQDYKNEGSVDEKGAQKTNGDLVAKDTSESEGNMDAGPDESTGTNGGGDVPKPDGETNEAADKSTSLKGKREAPKACKELLVARPFVNMRGHTAFLTFATAGNLPQPDPKAKP